MSKFFKDRLKAECIQLQDTFKGFKCYIEWGGYRTKVYVHGRSDPTFKSRILICVVYSRGYPFDPPVAFFVPQGMYWQLAIAYTNLA